MIQLSLALHCTNLSKLKREPDSIVFSIIERAIRSMSNEQTFYVYKVVTYKF